MPSGRQMVPLTSEVRRRRTRAGVLSRRWAYDVPTAASTAVAAAAQRDQSTEGDCATKPTATGKPPQPQANTASVCSRPEKSSRL